MSSLSIFKINLYNTLMSGASSAALSLDFLGGTLDPRITFTRGSNATLVDSTGKITYAPANLFQRSEEFDNAFWTKAGVTVSVNATPSPDGTSSADRIVEDTSTGNHNAFNAGSGSAGTHTMSVFAKPAGRDWIIVRIEGIDTWFNVANGTVGTVGAGVTASITAAANGFYRCAVTKTLAGATACTYRLATANNISSYTGDGTSGIFIWGAQLEPVTYQTTAGTYNATTSAAINAPRFDYDPVTLAAKGLLIEEQRVNLALQSNGFTQSATWTTSPTGGSTFQGTGSQAIVTGNYGVSPDGTSNAARVQLNLNGGTASSDRSGIAQGFVYSAVPYAYSFYIKSLNAVTSQDLASKLNNGPGGTRTIVDAGNGWVRVIWTFTPTAGSSTFRVQTLGSIGPDSADFLLYGAQLEAGAFATSYISTVASQVTRSADVASMTGTNFSSWYNDSEGSFVASYEASPNTFTTYLAASNGVVAQNSMHMDNDGAGNMRVAYYSGSSAVALLSLGAVGTIGAVNRVATAYKVNDFAASRNGGAVVIDTVGAVPVGVNRLNIGADPSGAAANVTNTHIRTIAYYNTRLPDATLQALTT